ncbi:MAG: MFS transporter [Planctomycetaceae bacterium]|nr:MFS transporter [Planctomycetaceae bacterium]
MLQPLREAVDATRQRDIAVTVRSLFSLANILAPVRSMRLSPSLPSLTVAAVALAFVHGILASFMVTYMTTEIGLPFTVAGITYSALQMGGLCGRILVGWISDRIGSILATLKVLAVLTTVMTLAIATIAPGWPVPVILMLIVVTGLSATSWNGIHLAEVARLAPERAVGDTAAGSVFFTFLAYSLGPLVFSLAVAALGSYSLAFSGTAFLGLVALWGLIIADRRACG